MDDKLVEVTVNCAYDDGYRAGYDEGYRDAIRMNDADGVIL